MSQGLFTTSTGYKPFRYPWAWKAWKQQRSMAWQPEEVSLDDDVRDWKHNLTDNERHVITQIFRFFTQGDIDIAHAYLDRYIPMFKPTEVRMMLTQFAAMESLHIHAYSLLLDTVGMPEVEYQAFMKYQVMADKHAYFYQNRYPNEPLKSLGLDLAIFSAFGEGMQLFSSFAILMSFQREGFNLMGKMNQIIQWSIKDESLHVESMLQLFHTFLDENPEIWDDSFKASIYQACREMVVLEDLFIDLCFEMGNIRTITKQEVREYIRFIADRRLNQLGLKAEFNIEKNPLPWIEKAINLNQFTNFFEREVVDYSTAATQGTWTEAHDSSLYDLPSLVTYFKGIGG